MSHITITNLTFAYEGSYDTIFDTVSLQLDSRWKLGLIGRNGRGKTTFLQLLLGNYPYQGHIDTDISFTYFPYPVADTTQNTIDILQQICPTMENWELLRELNLLQVLPDVLYRPFYTLSNGEQTKVLLAALFLKENNFLLLDEPTNHLDELTKQLLANYLNRKQSFLLVSHDRTLLDHCVDHILAINRANIELQKGNFSSWYQNKLAQDNLEFLQNEQLKKEIGKFANAAKRTSNWSDQLEKTKYATKNSGLHPDRGYIGHKSAKMMKRAKVLEQRQQKAIEQKSQLLKNIETTEPLKINCLPYAQKRLLSLQKVSVCYQNNPIFSPISLDVMQGDRVCISGKNGCGKSSLLKLILGQPISYTGTLSIGSQLTISYLPQDTSFLHGSLTDFAAQSQIDESLFKAILRKLDFSRTQFDKEMQHYSAGQKKKVLLAKSLCESANLYIWDEPFNFIDIFSRIQIEELLLTYQPTMLFVEHDHIFTQKIATQTITIL